MRAVHLSWILAAATLSSAGLSVKDTVVFGVPGVRLMNGSGWDGELKIDSERGELRASLEGRSDSVLVVFDRNPFARMAGRTRPLQFPPRVTKSRLVLPKIATADLFPRLDLGRAAVDKTAIKATIKPSSDSSKADPVRAPVVAMPTHPSVDTPSVLPPTAPHTPEPSVVPPEESDSVDAPETPSTPSVEVPKAPSAPAKMGVFTVVIDAGHGGKDPGANGKKANGTAILEKMATLQVARRLRDVLASRKGIKVVMTRDQDVFVELAGRTRIANEAKGDLFVSLHCNSLPTASKRRDAVNGFMVYLLREAKDERDRAIERRENEAISYETGEHQKKEALSPVEWMLLDHQLNLYTKESERFAGLVVRKLQAEGPVTKERTGASQAGFFVLVGALMPSVLIEMGYVSNAADADALSDTDRQKKIAEGIADAIDGFRSGKH
jgi:N-acetylmuramoyl-L-alanine amidase